MSREKTAEFLADCLSNMPDQPKQVQRVVDTGIAGLKRIANGQEWPADAAWEAADAALDAAFEEAKAAAEAADAVAWEAAAWAASAARAAAAWAAVRADWAVASNVADWAAADQAARAHPDRAKERARQATKRKELGL